MNTPGNTPGNTPDNTPGDPWESEMSDEFERRVRDLHEAPFSLDNVKGKAMNIKRKRQAFAACTALAVAAAVVPIALLASNGNSGDKGIQPTGNTPSQTVVDTPSIDPTTPSTPPANGAYGFDFIEVTDGNAQLHEAGGGVIELPRGDYTDAAVLPRTAATADLGGTIAAYRQGDDAGGFVDLIVDDAVTKTYDVRSSMVITPTASAVAFVTTEGELLVVSADGVETSFGTDLGPNDVPSALIGDGDCGVESGCHPFIDDANGASPPYEINYEGPDTVVVPDAISINDANDDFLVSIQTSYSDTGSCGGLFDRQAQEFVFETCKAQVLEISPQGDHVIGTGAYGDGIGDGFMSILDDTGTEIARYTPTRGYINRMAWADDTHAVATVYADGAWSIVSLGTDGTVTTVAGPSTSGSDADPAYFLTGIG